MTCLKPIIAIFLLGLTLAPLRADLILLDSYDVAGANSPGNGFGSDGPAAGVNFQVNRRLSGAVAAGLQYLQTGTAKAASAYSIVSNKLCVAASPNPGRITFTSDGVSPMDFGLALGSGSATRNRPIQYELATRMCNRSKGEERTSFGLVCSDSGIQNWDLGIQLVNNGSNLDLYRRVDGASNPNGSDYNQKIATLAGRARSEVELRLRITDAGAESGPGNFNSRYEVVANGISVFTSAPGEFRFAGSAKRFVLIDTAPNAGPVTWDDLSLSLIDEASTIVGNANVTALGSSVAHLSPSLLSQGDSYRSVSQRAASEFAVLNLTAGQCAGSPVVDIYYDLMDAGGGQASISVLVSTDGGQSYYAPVATLSGDVGAGIAPGSGRHIGWNVGMDWPGLSAANVRVQVVADRAPVGADMALIPAGVFNMGTAKAEGLASESPVHAVNVSAFYMARHEVTKALWDEVVQWGINHGYTFDNPGVAVAPTHPVQQVSWYDAAKWCNARSEKEGLTPAYYEDLEWTTPWRTGQVDLSEGHVRWQGTGYRLPTEAEWEKAARGGLEGKRFPFGDTITQAQANYWSTSFEMFDVNGTAGPHPQAPEFPNVLAVGSFRPSGYGLYDMAGNSWEWCWDYYGDGWYSDERAGNADTRGPQTASWGGDRVYRGGSGVDIAWKSRVANRADAPPRFAMGHFGFRVVQPTGGQLIIAQSPSFHIAP